MGGTPVSLEKRDEVKLRETLVELGGSLVRNHEEGVVTACAAHAHKLPQSFQEVIRTCGGYEKIRIYSEGVKNAKITFIEENQGVVSCTVLHHQSHLSKESCKIKL